MKAKIVTTILCIAIAVSVVACSNKTEVAKENTKETEMISMEDAIEKTDNAFEENSTEKIENVETKQTTEETAIDGEITNLTPEIIKAYRAKIQQLIDGEIGVVAPYEIIRYADDDKNQFFFSLMDVNDDGIDELLMQHRDDEANVFFVDSTGEYSDILLNYYDAENNICYYDDCVDLSTIKVFKLNGKEQEIIEEYKMDTPDEFETFQYYQIDNNGNQTEITEELFMSIEYKVCNEKSFEKYVINDENIDKYLPIE